MAQVLPDDAPPVHDLIGFGFGSCNEALAISFSKRATRERRVPNWPGICGGSKG
ncbi:hypothetical protein FHS42_005567 [Streptomyces zagrosensis]|uniref:Uncharacterized protein n=1 Tax=Streptomyces zagrosensis TaxID=1042984 RepID=A0A7W9V0R1_9ACTN|nr:hypothetical protein [Streptomyces zagrosensis]